METWAAGFVAGGADPVGIGGVAEFFLLGAVEIELEAAGIEAGEFLALGHMVALVDEDGLDAGADLRDDDGAVEGLDGAIAIDVAARGVEQDGEG